MKLRKSLFYLLLFTLFASFFTYKIVVSAYENITVYDIDNLKN